ncbi:phytanoyl-CoA dioxygenase family protein [Allocoleopsis franciscana]|uniref:Protein involved in biosynthesis of mitomycin antibiotics/polyketide fumonisin n=1 Tax=Allocoleopsis franciscana PCC 7113 TaxID=1173027 RepID=K9WIG9_9CYAN|nr:phytanoyl-CoA dioxygenase family protein [Allocoleopsis franciscana]AFZ19332.1 protein involved in biosynthesis of mitomycin antibiotics/polyketide fumonisin [Allocoleopsis franciscana PCC 7113]
MSQPKEYYDENGYYIFQKLIPESLIDQLLDIYKSQVLNSNSYFFRQSSNRWERNQVNEFGYCEESFLNVHDYPNHPEFDETIKQIFCSPQVRDALTQLTNSQEHNLMQSMLFDLNAATPAHQDWYYLDSMPSGHLLAGWFALEDIHEEAGRFYVLPKSHRVELDLTADEKASNSPYMKKLKEYVELHQNEIYAPALKKGDVLFWNSGTVHGSFPTLNPQYSRKSLTAHYLPSQYPSGSRYAEKPSIIDYEVYQGMQYRLVPSHQKYYSPTAKLRTDVWQYVWNRPKLARVAQAVKKTIGRA